MKITKQIQVGTKTIKETVFVDDTFDENGNILTEGHEEEVEKEIPIYEFRTVDMTPEEEEYYRNLETFRI